MKRLANLYRKCPLIGTWGILTITDDRVAVKTADMTSSAPETKTTVCVTGATGYIGSWLARSLLRRGYAVHAAVRDPDMASRLLSEFDANGQLKIFKANLYEEGSFDDAIKGCMYVFHVAASMEFSTAVSGNIDDHVKTNILQPAVRGTINLIQACWRAGSVKRVIFTSSTSTLTGKSDTGFWRSVVDELSARPASAVWETKSDGWVYVLSKLLTEKKAFEFAAEKGIELVAIIPPTVGGPFLTENIPSSVQVLLSPITGDPKLYPILQAGHSRFGSIALVHIEDICNAHIFLIEQPAANLRYICAAGSCVMPQLEDLLSLEYPSFTAKRYVKVLPETTPPVISSKRLTDLGFKFEYSIRDIIKQSIACCEERGFLKQRE